MTEQKVGIIFSRNGCVNINSVFFGGSFSTQVLELSFHWYFAVRIISSQHICVERDLKNHLGLQFSPPFPTFSRLFIVESFLFFFPSHDFPQSPQVLKRDSCGPRSLASRWAWPASAKMQGESVPRGQGESLWILRLADDGEEGICLEFMNSPRMKSTLACAVHRLCARRLAHFQVLVL